MDLNFLLPAATFFVVSSIIMLLTKRSRYIAARPFWSVKGVVLMMVPGILAGFLVWVAYSTLSLIRQQDFPRSEIESSSPWAGLSYFGAMIAGMAAHTAFDAIGKRKQGVPPLFDPWLFVQPALVAPIIFLGVRGVLAEKAFTLETLLLAFQNGFFWQTVLGGLRKPTSSTRTV